MGFNIPVSDIASGSSSVTCATDLNPHCPSALAAYVLLASLDCTLIMSSKSSKNAAGQTVECRQACFANYDLARRRLRRRPRKSLTPLHTDPVGSGLRELLQRIAQHGRDVLHCRLRLLLVRCLEARAGRQR